MTNRFREPRWKNPALKSPRRRSQKAVLIRRRQARELASALELNRLIAEAAAGMLDERGLMDGALAVITRLADAMGCSFVPVDEWQQPLPPFTYGKLPAPVMAAWSAKLASGLLRERCGACGVLHSSPGDCPLHPLEAGEDLHVYCLPLTSLTAALKKNEVLDQTVRDRRTGRPLGVLHLYLPDGRKLAESTRVFIDRVLPDISLAYEAARLRSQEAATMRQLNLNNDPEGDLTGTLNGLLDGLRSALEADFVLLRARPDAWKGTANGLRQSGLTIRRGGPGRIGDPLSEAEWDALVEAAMEPALRSGLAVSAPEVLPVWSAAPLTAAQLPHGTNGENGNPPVGAGRLQGIVMAVSTRPRQFHPRQLAILQAVTAQAALLVEYERKFRSLEYSVVIQERARLAREIHDGLAQTLAFLKLQAAQMQAQLAQGDLDRLAQVLNDSYHVLGEAYLDTRQAIDNLRMTPQDGLDQWIERIIREFERKAGLKVERSVQPLTRPVPPEVQAQLIRIVQEALSNVRKHARAERVRVCLCEQPDMLVIEVIDDGQGFDVDELPDVSRHGLRGMRERAEMIGADFQIITQAHQGTTMRLAVPVWDAEARPA